MINKNVLKYNLSIQMDIQNNSSELLYCLTIMHHSSVTQVSAAHVPLQERRMPARVRVLQCDRLVPRRQRRAAADLRLGSHSATGAAILRQPPTAESHRSAGRSSDGDRCGRRLLSVAMRQRSVSVHGDRVLRPERLWRRQRRGNVQRVP